ncbi:MAG: hypothetical protein ACRER2_01860 [Methylococcales bacterium]
MKSFPVSRFSSWRTQVIAPGKILAVYSYKRSCYQEIVEMDYDFGSHNIQYKCNSNLKFKAGTNEPGSESSFEDIISSGQGGDDQSGKNQKTIHKAYNEWVRDLERRIYVALLTLSGQGQSALVRARSGGRLIQATLGLK